MIKGKRKYKGIVTINGIEHEVEVLGGVRYIDGMPVDKWIEEKANILEILDAAKVGHQAIYDEIKGTKPANYQKMFEREFIKRSN